MSSTEPNPAQWRLIHRAVARLRASIMAVVFGGVGGVGLFLATALLLIRGGEVVGPTLARLNNYLPGYSVTWPGALLGFVYGALIGGGVGWSVAWIYNFVAQRRAAGD